MIPVALTDWAGSSGRRCSALLQFVARPTIQGGAAQDILTVVSDGAGPALTVNRPDVLVNVTFLFGSAPAGEVIIRAKFRPDTLRRHRAGPHRPPKRLQRLRAGILLANRKRVAHLVGCPQYLVLGGWRLPFALLRRIRSGTSRFTLRLPKSRSAEQAQGCTAA